MRLNEVPATMVASDTQNRCTGFLKEVDAALIRDYIMKQTDYKKPIVETIVGDVRENLY